MSDLTYAGAFSGVGMMELGCERVGLRGIWSCDSDPFCRRVLRDRFGIPVSSDVKLLTGVEKPDVFVFGFPCQDLSSANPYGVGLQGNRSGLWFEGLRLIKELQPKLVLIENVALLRSRGLDVVIGGLWEAGYLAEWDVLPAASFGAPHLRERIWIMATPMKSKLKQSFGEETGTQIECSGKMPRAGRSVDCGTHPMINELIPLAPRKTKRVDGWSYWIGNQLGFSIEPALLPTLSATINGNTPENHLRKKAERCGGPRNTISDLSVLAQNDFHQATGEPYPSRMMLLPTAASRDWKDVGTGRMGRGQLPEAVRKLDGAAMMPTPVRGDARNSRNATATRTEGSLHKTGTTLSDFVRLWPTPTPTLADGVGGPGRSDKRVGGANLRTVVAEEKRLWPTPTHSPQENRGTRRYPAQAEGRRGKHLSGEVGEESKGQQGSLNPDWVEWLMGMPIGWTDLSVPLELLIFADWAQEPNDIPRVSVGTPNRAARLMAIGNSCLNQTVEWVLRRKLEGEL